jgi:hypothetical protein
MFAVRFVVAHASGTSSSIHFDTADNILAQVDGEKVRNGRPSPGANQPTTSPLGRALG